MEGPVDHIDSEIDQRIAHRLKALRSAKSWSLDELASRTGVSRASLSRLENAEVSATASVLGRLCAAYDLPMSRLMMLVEEDFEPLLRRAAQPVWRDPQSGFLRRSVSPPAQPLSAEMLECELRPATQITYDQPPRQGLEHHLLLLEGELRVRIGEQRHDLHAGDCLRYRLTGPSAFETPDDKPARYVLCIV